MRILPFAAANMLLSLVQPEYSTIFTMIAICSWAITNLIIYEIEKLKKDSEDNKE